MDKSLSERLEALAKAAQDRSDNSRMVADYLAPEIKALQERAGHNIYAARMAVDHRNSARTDAKEAATLREAAELARRVEDAPKFTAERVTAAGMTWVGVDVTGHVEYGQRARLVPEAGQGGGDGP